ncbi:fungal-specific transcription factor domain-containing protein [Plectosphaerella plurivora]|uniref:Fungal-specific transcription factor domain-containing protein n=1 Tax=Plectosphaerella plurivora TaxID=936078 RepID=A0A9P8V6J4_9PEZI|nr:fungal-specific transcription factor domain-containing protein [Plectosphaerella plurivora]
MDSSSKSSHSKSRNGCLRCKAKKTKCDERKPACARCEDRGFQCPGYALDIRWSHKHQVRAERSSIRDGPPSRPRSRNLGRRQQMGDAGVAPMFNPDQAWLGSPSQWDLFMPQELMFPLEEPVAFPPPEQPNPFTILVNDADLMSTAWTVDNDSSPSGSVEEIPAVDTAIEDTTIQAEDAFPVDQLETIPFPSAPREIFNIPTALSEYFFREVITLYCLWDSKANVMRNIVETAWQSSGALHHTVQSMAAACLSEDFPHLQAVARAEHHQALALVGSQPSPSSSTARNALLLAAQLLGHTSSWLAPQNLATDMFRASCTMLNSVSDEINPDPSFAFFSDAMDYWAMLLVYLTDSSQLGDYRRRNTSTAEAPSTSAEPHPYSGISHEMVRVLTDAGILIFQYRKHMSSVRFMTERDLDVFKTALREARRLERVLLAHRAPDLTRFRDPGDPKTPLRHLGLMDEAYRCTGLLQLYRVFPDLLAERYAPWDRERLLNPLPAQGEPSPRERQAWLTKLAMHILGILRDIPFESRTRSVQPFVMVAAASELRRDPHHLQQPAGEAIEAVIPIDKTSIEVARARKFVGSRLAAYTHILPLRKSRVIFELINSVWSAMDAGEEDVYWLDVAYEKKLGTMMG